MEGNYPSEPFILNGITMNAGITSNDVGISDGFLDSKKTYNRNSLKNTATFDGVILESRNISRPHITKNAPVVTLNTLAMNSPVLSLSVGIKATPTRVNIPYRNIVALVTSQNQFRVPFFPNLDTVIINLEHY